MVKLKRVNLINCILRNRFGNDFTFSFIVFGSHLPVVIVGMTTALVGFAITQGLSHFYFLMQTYVGI